MVLLWWEMSHMALGDAVGGLMWPSWYSSTGRVSEEVRIGLLAFLMAWSWLNTPPALCLFKS